MAAGRPGVYITENLTPLPSSTTDTGAAVAAFVGTTNYGPSVPTLVTSWSQYAATYNSFGDTTSMLPYAVYTYFANGGTGCYVVRGVASDAVAGHVTLMDTQGTPASLITVTAKSTGAFSNNIFLTVVANGTTGFFDLLVSVGTTSNIVDRFLAVTLNPTDPRYLLPLVNSPTTGSQTISIAYVSSVNPWTAAQTPAPQANTPLASGADGTVGGINLVTAAQQLATLQGVFNINLPGVSTPATINGLTSWAAGLGNIFVVVDAPQASSTYAATLTAYTALAPNAGSGTPWAQSSYAAAYGPWLVTQDPSSLATGAVRTLPPGGAVLGQYAATDLSQGTYQSPSGVSTALTGVVGVDTVFQNADLDTLNTAGINVIRAIPRYGFCIMGTRTLAYGMPSRYVNIRRTLMYVESLLRRATQFALFEPNSSVLWNKISSTIGQQLNALMQAGYFASQVAATSYYVVCDQTNNTAASMAVGQVNVSVGVALAAPAEYVLINIGLFNATAQITSSL
jgi:hypothetical protein